MGVKWPKRTFLEVNLVPFASQLIIFTLQVSKIVISFFDWLTQPSQHIYLAGRLWLVEVTISVVEYFQLGSYPPGSLPGWVSVFPLVQRDRCPIVIGQGDHLGISWLRRLSTRPVIKAGPWPILGQLRGHGHSLGARLAGLGLLLGLIIFITHNNKF